MSKLVIGLTGNIGTGKSAVMRFAAERGVLTIDADKVVHHLLANDRAVQQKIGDSFGEEVLTESGAVNRPALGRIVFKDPAALERLEALVHPGVRRLIGEQIASSDAAVVMIEAIKLLEGSLASICDQIWVADCGKLLQMQRLVIGRGMDEEEAFRRIANQPPQEEKVARANVVIDTRGTLAETREQVEAALEASLPESAAGQAGREKSEDEKAPEGGDGPAPEIIVRRARPSDIPSILLLIHRATGGRIKPKRTEILMSLSERGYLLGQQGTEVSTVVGWYADKGFGAIEKMFVYPPEAAEATGRAVLAEVNRTANELMCEAIFAFVNDETPDRVRGLLADYGFVSEQSSTWPRVWQQTFRELKPESANKTLIKKLWDARVA